MQGLGEGWPRKFLRHFGKRSDKREKFLQKFNGITKIYIATDPVKYLDEAAELPAEMDPDFRILRSDFPTDFLAIDGLDGWQDLAIL